MTIWVTLWITTFYEKVKVFSITLQHLKEFQCFITKLINKSHSPQWEFGQHFSNFGTKICKNRIGRRIWHLWEFLKLTPLLMWSTPESCNRIPRSHLKSFSVYRSQLCSWLGTLLTNRYHCLLSSYSQRNNGIYQRKQSAGVAEWIACSLVKWVAYFVSQPALFSWHDARKASLLYTPLLVEKTGRAPDNTLRFRAHKQVRLQMREPPWLWNPCGPSDEVQKHRVTIPCKWSFVSWKAYAENHLIKNHDNWFLHKIEENERGFPICKNVNNRESQASPPNVRTSLIGPQK